MFQIDTKVKHEALNFATLMNALSKTELELEPRFSSAPFDTGLPLTENIQTFSTFFGISEDRLLGAYQAARAAFEELRETDTILKRGSWGYPPLLLKSGQAQRFLFVRGREASLHDTRTVAVVGKGIELLADTLGRNGVIVVSETPLHTIFNTITVLGTGLNRASKDVDGIVVTQTSPVSGKSDARSLMQGLSLAMVVWDGEKGVVVQETRTWVAESPEDVLRIVSESENFKEQKRTGEETSFPWFGSVVFKD